MSREWLDAAQRRFSPTRRVPAGVPGRCVSLGEARASLLEGAERAWRRVSDPGLARVATSLTEPVEKRVRVVRMG